MELWLENNNKNNDNNNALKVTISTFKVDLSTFTL